MAAVSRSTDVRAVELPLVIEAGAGCGDGEGGVLPQGDGNSAWDFLMSEVVEGTQYAYVPAGYLLQTNLPDAPEDGDLPGGLPLGTPIRVEVVAIEPGATELTAQTGAGVHSSYVHTFALGGP